MCCAAGFQLNLKYSPAASEAHGFMCVAVRSVFFFLESCFIILIRLPLHLLDAKKINKILCDLPGMHDCRVKMGGGGQCQPMLVVKTRHVAGLNLRDNPCPRASVGSLLQQ